MKTLFISGMNTDSILKCVDNSEHAALSLINTEAFLTSATHNHEDTFIWVYRAPWRWLLEHPVSSHETALNAWETEQQSVLKLRRTLKDRLILINADKVDVPALANLCGLSYKEAPNTLYCIHKTAISGFLAEQFEKNAPHCWDVYESLETIAWLPQAEAEFRGNYSIVPTEAFNELLQLVSLGSQFPTLNEALSQRVTMLAQVEHELNAKNNKLSALEVKLKESSDENELLLNQLFQVQEELEKRFLENKDLSEKNQQQHAASVSTQDAHNEALKKTNTELHTAKELLHKETQKTARLQQQLAALSAENTQLSDAQQSQRDEHKIIMAQLFQVQEELEKRFLENKDLSEKNQQQHAASVSTQDAHNEALKKTNTELHTAKELLHKETQKTARLQQQLAALSAENTQLSDAQQSQRDEHKIIMAQLFQVQEELESFYIKNKALEKNLHEAQKKSAQYQQQLETLAEQNNSQLTAVRQELASTQQKLQTQLDALAKAKTNNQTLTNKAHGLEEKLNAAIKKEAQLTQQLTSTKKALDTCQSINKEAFDTIKQSSVTFERARHLISQMVTL